jgi:hypothetical protein
MLKKLIEASVAVVAALVFATNSSAQEAQVPQIPSEMISAPTRPAHKLEDFSRLTRAVGERILLIDPNGVVREGVLAQTTADGVIRRWTAGQVAFLERY